MKCPLTGCNKEVLSVKITYGLYDSYKSGRPHHVIRLCSEHTLELWDRCKGAVQAGLMHWVSEESGVTKYVK